MYDVQQCLLTVQDQVKDEKRANWLFDLALAKLVAACRLRFVTVHCTLWGPSQV